VGKRTDNNPAPRALPVRLELNNSGAWKVIVRFDLRDSNRAARIMSAGQDLAEAVNLGQDKPQFTLRIVTDDIHAHLVSHYIGGKEGWRSKLGALTR
jgi:hypothetical protein